MPFHFNIIGWGPNGYSPKHHSVSQQTVCLVPSLGYPTSVEWQAGSNDVNEKGFSQLFQTFSCAVWFGWETNRNLLLAPGQPRHVNMPQDYELYLDSPPPASTSFITFSFEETLLLIIVVLLVLLLVFLPPGVPGCQPLQF
jgi:hypothetical protein